ncbi:malate dehydrogenase-like [Leptidea sinapis]|uniref:malate dehydrogenase-like n=1 Tax=Leptidea sinapis TaxID=189913 RepID=UPI0021424AA5|nr:malate dehydrogenase-like [Leptidea sinapis]
MLSRALRVKKDIFSGSRYFVPKRNVHVCVVGAAGDIGSNLALLLKQNPRISVLHLYDDDEKVFKIGTELNEIPGGPVVTGFTGSPFLPAAIRDANLILLVGRTPRRLGYSREHMLATNAPNVLKVSKIVAEQNPDAFFAISTNPINSIIPFVSSILHKYKAYDFSKVFGITHIDTARARAFTAKYLNINPRHLHVPVIGGHSDDTIVPLYSKIMPSHYNVDSYQADTLTRLLKTAGTKIISSKLGHDSATLAMAWSINECAENLIDALCGNYVIVNCYTLNPHFGTRYFSGPTKVGGYGIVEVFKNNFEMNEYEKDLLKKAVSVLNDDIVKGEDYVGILENPRMNR